VQFEVVMMEPGPRTSDVRTSCTCAFVSSLSDVAAGWFVAPFSCTAVVASSADMAHKNRRSQASCRPQSPEFSLEAGGLWIDVSGGTCEVQVRGP
jgi:hypothetical protein